MKKINTFLLAIIGLMILGGCASSKTIKFYALQSTLEGSSSTLSSSRDKTIGISRVIVPDYMKNQGVTSLADNSGQLSIALTHAWAGELDTQLTQIIAQDVSKSLNQSSVWPSPWPHGIKPEVRVQVVIEQLAGVLTEQVSLRAKWIVSDNKGKNEVASGVFSTKVAVQSTSKKTNYSAYTYAMSQVVGKLSQMLAEQIKQNID